MTLIEQIKEIATRWFNEPFSKQPIPRVVNALAIEAFRRTMHPNMNGWKQAEDCQAIYIALTHIDVGNLTEEIEAFLL